MWDTYIQPWYWRSLPLEHRTGSDIFAALFLSTQTEVATLLESPYPILKDNPQLARYSICAGKPRIVNGQTQMWTPSLGKILPFLEQLLRRQQEYNHVTSPPLPFIGGWLGWLGYNVAWEIEQLPSHNLDTLGFPIAFWYEPEYFAVLDHQQQILWLAASEEIDLDKLEKNLTIQHNSQFTTPLISSHPDFCTSQQDYEAAVRRVKKYIQVGDIFQANLSLRFQTITSASGWLIYQNLQKINPSPFASYWYTPWGEVVSCSPERLVQAQKCQDGKFNVSTRPIAGTRSRGTTSHDDQRLAADLLSNIKERAEHIMLVDLERNDLGRVCEWGSVKVDELLTIERYSHVMHLVSNVQGILRCEHTPIDLIRAMFPGGTITGCPKIRCMEIIEELEPYTRSLFYGSCGYLDFRGNLDLNILIRTLLVSPMSDNSQLNSTWGQVGAGIVADSDPQREWYESLHKAQAQLKALSII